MKLQAGKRYTRRDGSVTSPLTPAEGHIFPFSCSQWVYTDEGRWSYVERECPRDLIAEYIEPTEEVYPIEFRLEDSNKIVAGVIRSQTDEIKRLKAELKQWVNNGSIYCGDAELVYGLRTAHEQIDRLRAEVNGLLKQNVDEGEINDTLRARVEELSEEKVEACLERNALAERVEELETHKAQRPTLGFHHEVLKERDSLKARVEELEDYKAIAHACERDYRDSIIILKGERDELRTQLHDWKLAYNTDLRAANAVADELRTRLADLDKVYLADREAWRQQQELLKSRLAELQQPKVTVVKSTWQAIYSKPQVNGKSVSLELGHRQEHKRQDTIGYIRRDHMSDGTVVATLEPIGGEK